MGWRDPALGGGGHLEVTPITAKEKENGLAKSPSRFCLATDVAERIANSLSGIPDLVCVALDTQRQFSGGDSNEDRVAMIAAQSVSAIAERLKVTCMQLTRLDFAEKSAEQRHSEDIARVVAAIDAAGTPLSANTIAQSLKGRRRARLAKLKAFVTSGWLVHDSAGRLAVTDAGRAAITGAANDTSKRPDRPRMPRPAATGDRYRGGNQVTSRRGVNRPRTTWLVTSRPVTSGHHGHQHTRMHANEAT